uniref:Transposase domain protein n=1 Tax=Rhizobium rhizogenes TaxID=359 RepID=A0A7S5DR20_RHIRH|nr:transposase domain protein [Rhizobium rhizogenes]
MSKGFNNRAENFQLAVWQREKGMMCFKSARRCQRFISINGSIANPFQHHRTI